MNLSVYADYSVYSRMVYVNIASSLLIFWLAILSFYPRQRMVSDRLMSWWVSSWYVLSRCHHCV